jgi:hypothetical protein
VVLCCDGVADFRPDPAALWCVIIWLQNDGLFLLRSDDFLLCSSNVDCVFTTLFMESVLPHLLQCNYPLMFFCLVWLQMPAEQA